MGNPEKLMAQIFDLKFTSKSLQRQARKCEKEEKEQKLKVKKAIEKGNVDGARIYAEKAGGSALGLPYAHGPTSAFLIRRSRGSMAAFTEEERAVDDHLGHPP